MNIYSHIRNGWFIIVGVFICINFQHILPLLHRTQTKENYTLMGIFVFVLFVLPAIILHVNYYFVNRGDVIEYSSQDKVVMITHRGVTTFFTMDDISHVEKSISFNEAAKRVPVVSWDKYNHSVIYLTNGNVFTITSLLVPDFDLPIENERIKIKRNIYRLAKIR